MNRDDKSDSGAEAEVEEIPDAAGMTPVQLLLEKAKGLVEAHGELKKNYFLLFIFLVFYITYFIQLFGSSGGRKDIADAFLMRSAILKVVQKEDSDGSILQVFSNKAEVYDWLKNDVLANVYTDPKCDDGVCESGVEFEALSSEARFGCFKDCGLYPNTTTLTVTMTTSQNTAIDFTKFYWNLCSSTQDFCFYKLSKPFTKANQTIGPLYIPVPDGEWGLRFTSSYDLDTMAGLPVQGTVALTTTVVTATNCTDPENSNAVGCADQVGSTVCLSGASAVRACMSGASAVWVCLIEP
jgi:hypothetical protein